jgi:peptide chain release factor 2
MDHEYRQVMHEFEEFELLILLNHEFDRLNAIVEIHPGAGGTESQDWADMLYRMYVRYADLKSFKVETVDYQVGEEAGLKSVMFVVRGSYAYGYLKAEKGVHRLVRISPFDASGRRHTSFASVDVIPEFTADTNLSINEADLRIDTYRAGGAGGQHINKTDSAVRITHLPSGIVVTSQSQRSQIQNREQAMVVLKAKLYQKKMEEKQMELDRIRGVQKSIEWGSQIRSYVFQPYTLVKDHRSNYETGDVQRVMNGDLDALIYAVLKMGVE